MDTQQEQIKEEWRHVPFFENKYMVSNKGKIVSLNFKMSGIKKEMSPWLHHGYKLVTLCMNGKTKQVPIHRLVAEAFIPNPNNYPIVNHKDENKLNNCADNLEWCTNEYNITYGTANQRRAEKGKVPILQMTVDSVFVRRFDSAKEAGKLLGIGHSSITAVCKGRQKTAYGFKWRYEDEDRYLEFLQINKIREYQKNINIKQAGLKRSKKVCQFTLEGELIREFASCLIASKETGICMGSIQQNCGGFRKQARGFIFKYKE